MCYVFASRLCIHKSNEILDNSVLVIEKICKIFLKLGRKCVFEQIFKILKIQGFQKNMKLINRRFKNKKKLNLF
jgi:hypothetical protein